MAGAFAADLLIAEGTEFSVAIRKGEIETLKSTPRVSHGVERRWGTLVAKRHRSDSGSMSTASST
jgi:hypothetical protein